MIHSYVAVFAENLKSVLLRKTPTRARHFEHSKPRNRRTFRRPQWHTRDDGPSPFQEHTWDGEKEDVPLQ